MINCISLEKLNILFCCIYIIEIIIGGGGTIFKLNDISLRIALFVLIIFNSLLILFQKRKINKKILIILLFYIFLTLLSSGIGKINGAKNNLIFIDIKQGLSIFIMIPFFIYLNKNGDIEKIVKIIKKFSMLLVIIQLILILIIKLELIPFNFIYEKLSKIGTTEFMFRPNKDLFFKGYLYLNIGLIFLYFEKKKNIIKKLMYIIAIYFTGTRGFYLSLFLCYLIEYLKKISVKKLFLLLIGIIPLINIIINKIVFSIERIDSNAVRFTQIKEVYEKTTIFSFFFGNGLGMGVESNPIHMEITYLEIFHKQGILGILFWTILLIYIILNYLKINTKERKEKYIPFFYGTLFIYFQSATNPFLTNPIGLTFVCLSFVVGELLRVDDKINSDNCTSYNIFNPKT